LSFYFKNCKSFLTKQIFTKDKKMDVITDQREIEKIYNSTLSDQAMSEIEKSWNELDQINRDIQLIIDNTNIM